MNHPPLNQRDTPSTRQPNLKYWANQILLTGIGLGIIVVAKVLLLTLIVVALQTL